MEPGSNGFTPGFGEYPTVLVGRDQILDSYRDAFNAPNRLRRSVISAARGSGKTVLLDAIQDTAARNGWLVVQQDAGTHTSTLGERIIDDCQRLHRQHQPQPRRRATGASISAASLGASIDWENTSPTGLVTVRNALRDVVEASAGNGLLVTVDEVHEATRNEIHELGNAVQHLTREQLPIAFVGAGLPMLASDEPTFLRRCAKPTLELTSPDDVRAGLVDIAATGDWQFTRTALDRAVDVSAGLPYMMQLVGYEAVEQARADRPRTIRAEHIAKATDMAARSLASAVSARLNVSAQDMRFLLAVAIDDGPATAGDIARRVGRSGKQVSVYRRRMIDAGLVVKTGHGEVDFVEPWMRALLRSLPIYRRQTRHVISEELDNRYRLDATVEAPPRFR